jgi:DNA-binding response OmpR family regulator
MTNVLSILIIEDDDLTAGLYQKILEDADFNVLTVATTKAAEQALGGIEINLVILDHHLPDKDGEDWLEELHSQEEFEKLPVILVSTIARETGPLRYDPYVWFLEKPRQPQQIVTAVQSTIERFSD